MMKCFLCDHLTMSQNVFKFNIKQHLYFQKTCLYRLSNFMEVKWESHWLVIGFDTVWVVFSETFGLQPCTSVTELL